MTYTDYYAVLGVARNAELESIKQAYRKLARKNHPDLAQAPGAEARFKEAAEAYATLKDPEKRAAYDLLDPHPPGQDFAPPPHWQPGYSKGGDNAFGDINLADLLDTLNRNRNAHKHRPVRGRDWEESVHISLLDAHRGTTLALRLRTGETHQTLEVQIPAGVHNGQKLRLRGKGGKGQHGGADGNIYLHIVFARDPLFRVHQSDLYFDLLLAPWEAVLGAELEIHTLDGPLLLTVPPASNSGRKLRLRGRGLAQSGSSTRGDLYARIQIAVPSKLSAHELALYQELSRYSDFQPRSNDAPE